MSKQYNLLFLFADQWRRDLSSPYGDKQAITPNMEQMAAEGVKFTNAISTFPLCSPHRASLLTGKHPLSTGVFTNCKTGLSMRLKEEEVCAGDILKVQGYQTAYIGKWHLDEPELNHCDHPKSGAQRWDAFTPEGVRRHGFDFWHVYNAWDQHLHPHYWDDTDEIKYYDQWSVEHETEVALNYLDQRNQEQPFAMFISWNPPHNPYDQVPDKYFQMYDKDKLELRPNVDTSNIIHHTYEPADMNEEELRTTTAQYYAAVSGLDDNLGKIVAYLKEHDLYDNTLLVLSSDHGDQMGAHGLLGKHVWYEESIGIPFMMAGAGLPKGQVVETPIGSPDMLPTMLSLMNCEGSKTFEGVDLAQCITTPDQFDDKVCYLAACPGRNVFLDAFEEAGKNPMDFGWRGIRNKRYAYIVEAGYEVEADMKRMLYDLETDPYQMNPMIVSDSKEHELTSQMEQQLVSWLEEQKDGFLQHM